MARRRQVPKSGFKPGNRLDLRKLSADLQRLEEEQRQAVEDARAEGATWADIATMTGLPSRQAAHYRFGRNVTTEGKPLASGFSPMAHDLEGYYEDLQDEFAGYFRSDELDAGATTKKTIHQIALSGQQDRRLQAP